MRRTLKLDLYRYTGGGNPCIPMLVIKNFDARVLLYFRMPGVLGKLLRARINSKYGLNLGDPAHIGPGLYLSHAHCIDINKMARIGKNCNLSKGVTVGIENRGKRKGAPTIGDNVWIGAHATVVGKISVGSDVLIAPGAYVNFDIPDHSIVIGNPGKVIHCDFATENYINRTIDTD